jgi:SAM-dependent methyltransferase
MDFTCNVCGTKVTGCLLENIDREIQSCPQCHSTVRFRSIVHILSMALYQRSIPLPGFPKNLNLIGLGLSDWPGYAEPLARKFNYTNTYFHQPPHLDISMPVSDRAATCNFVIATEVFEHVSPPVSRAFTSAYNLLKPGGHLILTVPFTYNNPSTVEHFPDLHDYRIIQFNEEYVLVNRKRDGRYALHENLIFHGGPGTTLEMRLFCWADLEQHLTDAGFTNVQIFGDDVPEWGILHKHPGSLPILAMRPI